MSPDGERCALATSSRSPSVRVFDTKDGSEVARTGALMHSATGLYFSPDGRSLTATGHGPFGCRNVWDWDRSEFVRAWPEKGYEWCMYDMDRKGGKQKWRVGLLTGLGCASDGSVLVMGQDGQLRILTDIAGWGGCDPEPNVPRRKR
jgi:WD40 repeat protein